MRHLVLLLPLLSGCAAFAVHPATPAKYLDVRGVELPPPCEHYYLLIFSSQDEFKQPRYTHTWVTAIRYVARPAGQLPYVENHSISWMPRTLEIEPTRLFIEPGVNLTLHRSITDVALANKEQVLLWGPYEIRPALYQRILVQKQFMESGQMGYQCVDTVGEAARTGKGCNCIHAITDMDAEYGRRQYPLTRYGFSAGRQIGRRMREMNALVHPERTHDFLIPLLGLSRYPIGRAAPEEIFEPSRSPIIGLR